MWLKQMFDRVTLPGVKDWLGAERCAEESSRFSTEESAFILTLRLLCIPWIAAGYSTAVPQMIHS